MWSSRSFGGHCVSPSHLKSLLAFKWEDGEFKDANSSLASLPMEEKNKGILMACGHTRDRSRFLRLMHWNKIARQPLTLRIDAVVISRDTS